MQKITWRKTVIGEDGDDDVVTTYHGVNLGPIVKDGVTCLVVW